MENKEEYLQSLSVIRSMMEQSSRFISLSGLSGIAAGLCGIVAGVYAYFYFGTSFDFISYFNTHVLSEAYPHSYNHFIGFVLLNGGVTLLCAVALATFFTVRKAKKTNQKLFDPISKRLLMNMALPLVTGGMFCVGLLYHKEIAYVPAASLMFYGMALVNASKYTLHDIRTLGITQLVLGIVAVFAYEYSLILWTFGFGVLHILYGIIMYVKYDRK